MKAQKETLVQLMTELGYKNPEATSAKRLVAKLKIMLPKVDEETIEEIEDEDAQALLKKLVKTPDLLEKLVIEGDDDEDGAEEAPKAKDKKASKKKAAKAKDEDEEDEDEEEAEDEDEVEASDEDEEEEDEEDEDEPKSSKKKAGKKDKSAKKKKKAASTKEKAERDDWGAMVTSQRHQINAHMMKAKKPLTAKDVSGKLELPLGRVRRHLQRLTKKKFLKAKEVDGTETFTMAK